MHITKTHSKKNMKNTMIPTLTLLLGMACATLAGCTDEPDPSPAPAPAPQPQPTAADSSFFEEVRLYAPGDHGSTAWRIPALIALPDGTLLAINDRRKNNEADLPEDIDIVCARSTDRGRTWSEPSYIATGTGRKQGFGDAGLVLTAAGDVVCVFAGGNGIRESTEADPIRSYACHSTDGGLTWSEPQDLTAMLWGSQASDAGRQRIHGSFFSSGNGLRLTRGEHAGRILFVANMCGNANIFDNYAVYSDDGGTTWQVSALAFHGGDEAKLIELADGSVLMSVRRQGERGYNRSADGGATWGDAGYWSDLNANACNGDMLRLMATDRGDSINLIVHSLPNSLQRRDVSLFLSRDEGQTWHTPVRLCEGASEYSSLTMLDDGTIGAYVEKKSTGKFELWFQRFSVKWLLEQADSVAAGAR